MTDSPTRSMPVAAGTDTWDPSPRVRDLSITFVGWPSETGTDGEAAFSDHLADLLRESPAFRDHPENVVLVDSHGTPPRRSVVALVRGRGRKALALAGHFDTASIANYRELAGLCCAPEALKDALIADLAGRPRAPHEDRALADLVGGDFLPGRAMLDMKSGIAAGLAVLEHHAANPDREGSLLLIATPDEERNSQGMRSLRDALPGLMERWDIDIVGGINLDATSDQGDGEEGRAIYRGTIGKLMPFAFVLGEATHAAYPFDGISAHLVASAIAQAVEVNPALCDRGRGIVSPPPICLEYRDLRQVYEVTTPEKVFLAFNWLFHSWTPEALFERFRSTVEAALGSALSRYEAYAAEYGALAGIEHSAKSLAGRIVTVEALREAVAATGGDAATARIEALAASLAEEDNPLRQTQRLVEAMVEEARLQGPTVVIGFASLHYPPTCLNPERPLDAAFAAAVEGGRAASVKRLGIGLKYREIFVGISDMSFFGHATAPEKRAFLAAQTPTPHMVDTSEVEALSFPVVNIGPWGREYHQRLERLYTPYAFHDLPIILSEIAVRALAPSEREPSS